MRNVIFLKQFKRDVKKHHLALVTPAWIEVMNCLLNDIPIPNQYLDHALTGNFVGFRDVHIKNDLVLIYRISANDVLELHRLGSHAQVFG